MRNFSTIVVVCLLCLFVAAPVMADPVGVGTSFYWKQGTNSSPYMLTVDAKINMQRYSNSSNGGAFWVDLKAGSLGPYYTETPVADNVFTTWCVERTVNFSPGTDYWVSIDPKAYSGGLSGFNGDPISNVTEFIYDKWLSSGYAVTNAEQTAIRDAIHHAEDELASLAGLTRAKAIYDEAVLGIGGAGSVGNASHTYALNLWGGWDQDSNMNWFATDRQTQLITVPVPGAILLGLLGLSVAGIKLRKFA